jgi:hypothetical protein
VAVGVTVGVGVGLGSPHAGKLASTLVSEPVPTE